MNKTTTVLPQSTTPAQAATGRAITETLGHFGIGTKLVRAEQGPTITRFALSVEPGIRLARIGALADNLAMALAARSVRIDLPIPGQSLIGVEVPNTEPQIVPFATILASPEWAAAKGEMVLPIIIGATGTGEPLITDLARQPHLLIAGATGSGKSVAINTIIASLLNKDDPTRPLRLILINPKRVELGQYNGIPQLLTPVITEAGKAVEALRWVVGTMETRLALFEEAGARDLASYNEVRPRTALPRIVVVVDELADLMMVSGREVETSIVRIAQLARATGIHLVLATQRPSVDVITGLIKANLPSRIAFATTSGVDSRTILDQGGAEDLLGRGDLLYKAIDAPAPIRGQGAFIGDTEIASLVEGAKAQGGHPATAPLTPEARQEANPGSSSLLEQASALLQAAEHPSTGLLQVKLRITRDEALSLMGKVVI